MKSVLTLILKRKKKKYRRVFITTSSIKDLIKFGLIPEFIGRLPIITILNELNEDALIKILCKPKNALIKQYKTLFNLEKVQLEFTKEAVIAIAKKHYLKNRSKRITIYYRKHLTRYNVRVTVYEKC